MTNWYDYEHTYCLLKEGKCAEHRPRVIKEFWVKYLEGWDK